MDPQHSLYSARARYLAFDDSDYLIVERADTDSPLRAKTAKQIEAIGAQASGHSVLLWDTADQIQGVFDLDQTDRVPVKNFEPIRAVGVAPDLGHRLGKWKRQKQRDDGLWQVVFERLVSQSDPLSLMFEQQILHPWIEPGSNPDFDLVLHGHTHEATALESLQRTQENMRRLLDEYQFVPKHFRCIVVGSVGLGKSSFLRRFPDEKHTANLVLLTGEEHRRIAALTPKRATKGQRAKEPAAQSVDALINNLEATTAQALDTAAKTLPSTAQAPEVASDPIQNAIEIREHLRQTVRLLDAAEWAKWRGVKTKNPSAALGKYKNQNRVFAVRAGNRDLYPAFQFSENAEPLPVIEQILKVVPKDAQGWPLLSWFEAGSTVLRNRKPSEVFASTPAKVLEAARRFYSRDD